MKCIIKRKVLGTWEFSTKININTQCKLSQYPNRWGHACACVWTWQDDSKTDMEEHKAKTSTVSLEELNSGGNLPSGYQD